MEDILEELVGEIWDEHDEEKLPLRQLPDGAWTVDGSANLEKLFEELEIPRDAEDFDCVTVSGWIMQELRRIPAPGDTFLFDRYRVTVKRTERRRVEEIRMELTEFPAESTEEPK